MKFRPLPLIALTLSLFLSNCTKDNIINNKVPTADAGESKTIKVNETPGSITLSGKGSDADGKIVGYTWSQVSGPNAAQIVNDGAAETEVNNLIVGTYIFQLMVVDNDGATGLDTTSLIVTGPVYDTLALQPNKNPDEVHIWGNSSLNGSGPAQPEIGAAAWTSGDNVTMRAAFKFNLSSIPSNAVIKSAKLTLYSNPTPLNGDHISANSGTDNSMLIQRITTDWAAASVTFNNQPSSTNTNQVIIPSTSQGFLDLPDVDVTELVKNMTGANSNYGFLIKLQNETPYNSRIFCSSFYTTESKHPKLVVVYSK